MDDKEIFDKYIKMSINSLEAIYKDSKTSVIDLHIISLIQKSIAEGDRKRIKGFIDDGMIESCIEKYMSMSKDEIKKIYEDKSTTAMELCAISIMQKSISRGDETLTSCLKKKKVKPKQMFSQVVLYTGDDPDPTGDIVPIESINFADTIKIYHDVPAENNLVSFGRLQKRDDGVYVTAPWDRIAPYEGSYLAVEGQCRRLEFVTVRGRRCRKIQALDIDRLVIVPKNYDSRIPAIVSPVEEKNCKEKLKKKVRIRAKKNDDEGRRRRRELV